jgi:hypothetical protein
MNPMPLHHFSKCIVEFECITSPLFRRDASRLVYSYSPLSYFNFFANHLSRALQSIIMSAWGTGDMAAALPDANVEQPAGEQGSEAPATKMDPQAYGWVAPTKYDYETFNKTNKELEEAQASAEAAENQAE